MKYAKRTAFLIASLLMVTWLTYLFRSGQDPIGKTQKALHDEAASVRLKKEGLYDSLQTAISAARYRIYADERATNAFSANNPAQNLNACFTPSGSRIADCGMQNQGSVPKPQLALSLKGIGYGEAIYPTAGDPEMIADGNRISYKHQLAVANQSGFRDRQSAIEEWYVNKPEGIEQGFSISGPVGERGDGQSLRLELEIGGDYQAQPSDEGHSIKFKVQDAQLTYANLKAYDAAGKELAARMTVKQAVLSFEVDDVEATYPVTIDPTFAQQTKLTVISQAGKFGASVAIDGNFAVIGAADEFVNGNYRQGAAYVFAHSGTTWSQAARLTAFDGAADDMFGTSVAIDGATIVVGALSNVRAGAAYVYFFDVTWSLQQKLLPADVITDDQFGYSVSVSNSTIVVGAVNDDISSRFEQGSAYAFVRSGTTWSQQQKLTAGNGAAGDHFGYDVSIDGDYLIVGAPDRNSPTAPNEGAAYIFFRSGTNWVSVAFFQHNSGTYGLSLGSSVSISGNTVAIASNGPVEIWTGSLTNWTLQDALFNLVPVSVGPDISLNGDTIAIGTFRAEGVYETLVPETDVYVRSGTTWSVQRAFDSVGHPAVSGDTLVAPVVTGHNSLEFTNSASVFVRSGTTWSTQATLVPQASASSDEFGTAVAITSGGNDSGQGVAWAVIGVPNGGGEGRAWIFESLDQTTWSLNAILQAGDHAGGDKFGNSVAVSGNTIVVGAFFDNVGANADQGSAYAFVFNQTTHKWEQQQQLTAGDGAASDRFGSSVAISGDTVVVGADGDNVGANSDQGSAYVFTRGGTTWTQQQKLTASDGAALDRFGFSVGISGDTVIAGAFSDQIGPTFAQGSAYVFTRTSSTWTEQQKLTASDGAASDNFGNAVAISGDTVVVGADFDDIVAAGDNRGSAYVFTRSGAVWSLQQKLTASDGAVGDLFGFAVAIDGNTAIIGAPRVNVNSNGDQGAAYVFIRSLATSTWSERQKLIADDGAAGDQLGNAVAVTGQEFIIGAPFDDLAAVANAGSAYLFSAVPANIVWSGATSSNWQTDTNWSANLAPSVLDDAALPASGVTNEAIISALDVTINNLTIEAGRQLTINAGRTLTVKGNLTLNGTITGGGTLIVKGPTFTNNNFVSNVSVQFGGDGGVQRLSGTGLFIGNTIRVLSGSTLQVVSNHTIDRIVIDSGGMLNITSTNILSLLGAGVSFTNNGSVTGSGVISFDSTAAQSTAGGVVFPSLTINNATGVTLGADATVTQTLTLTNGDLNTGPFTLTMPATATSTGTTDVVGKVKRTGFTIGNTLSFGNPFNTIGFTSGTPPTDVTVNLVKQVPTDFTNAVRRNYTITPNGGSAFAATLRLHYQDAELNGNTEATLGLWRKGASWVNLGATTRNSTDNWAELAGIGAFSPWVISGPAAPTAVEFIGATATQFDGGTLVEWRTGFEVNNLGFRIYRQDAGARTLLNQELVAGSALVAGSGAALTAGRSYVWWDKGIANCGSSVADCQDAQYWLEDLDLNAASTWRGPFAAKHIGGEPPAHSLAKSLSQVGRSGDSNSTHPVEDFAQLARTAQSGSSPASLQQASLASSSAVKIGVRRAGWYRVSQTELINAGVDPKTDPRTLRLFADGIELPIFVPGENDGQLDSNDSVEFYGLGLNTPSTDTRVYWLIGGSQLGLRISMTPSAKGYPSGDSFPFTVERRDRTIYFSALRNGDDENFFGAVVTSSTIEQRLTLNSLAQPASESALIEVSLQGVTNLAHQVGVSLNGSSIGHLFFNGQAKGQQKIPVPQALLRDGENIVTLQSINGPRDISLVDWIRITYQHSYQTDSDSLSFVLPAGQSATISGFSSKDIRVLDVTEERDVRELSVSIEQAKDGYAATFTAPSGAGFGTGGTAGGRKLLALTSSKASRTSSVKANSPSQLRYVSNAAGFIIISEPTLFDSLRPLAALRTKQGLATSLVDVEDVFDEFSFGDKSPQSIKDFLSFAAKNWELKPRFILFAGDASYDARNYLGLGDNDIVPTKLLDTGFLETASDDWFTDFNNDGIAEIAVGRLPVRSVEEAIGLVSKIVSYEQSVPSDELLLVADGNEGFDFEAASEDLKALIPARLRVNQINRGGLDPATAKKTLIEVINRGQKLVNYVGHGNADSWRGSLLTTADARELTNGNHASLFIAMTCLNGYFHDAGSESLAEALLKSEGGGAVAVWASSGMTMPDEQGVMNRELYRQLFANHGIRLGEAINRAKGAVGDGDVRRTWILLGDPTMKVR